MKEYDVKITETLEKTVTVEAKSRADAEEQVRSAYYNSEYILDSENFTGVEFGTTEEREIQQEQAETMTVLLVKPHMYPQQIQIGCELEDLQKAVGGDIEAVYPFNEPVALVMHDEGKIMGKDLNRALRDGDGEIYDIIAGDFLVVGLGEEDFSSLAPFDIQEVRDITAYDELQLDTLGDKKTALFLIMSDTDATFNFLISMIYTQLFNLLCEKADDVYGGRLPVHVRCLIDEAANIGQIPNLEKLVATIRSREISACLVLQAQSQLKAIYKDNSDTIIGNMDSRIFLGGSEPTTLKELNQALGKETIDTYNTSNTRGNSPSYGMNYQKLGKDLATVDELAVLDGGKCILQLRGVRPFLSDKYDLTQHPNYKYTSDFDKKNEFNIEQFLSRRLKLKAGDEFVVVDAD